MGWSIKEKENEGRLIELVVICPPPASLEMRWLRRENYSHKAIREIQNISQTVEHCLIVLRAYWG
jgi:hypothetical protein